MERASSTFEKMETSPNWDGEAAPALVARRRPLLLTGEGGGGRGQTPGPRGPGDPVSAIFPTACELSAGQLPVFLSALVFLTSKGGMITHIHTHTHTHARTHAVCVSLCRTICFLNAAPVETMISVRFLLAAHPPLPDVMWL